MATHQKKDECSEELAVAIQDWPGPCAVDLDGVVFQQIGGELSKNWVAVKELTVSLCNPDAILFTIQVYSHPGLDRRCLKEPQYVPYAASIPSSSGWLYVSISLLW